MMRHLPEILILQAGLFLIYYFAFRRSKELRLNRYLLLLILLVPAFLPYLPKWGYSAELMTYQLPEIELGQADEMRTSSTASFSWIHLSWILGSLVLLLVRVMHLIRIRRWSRNAERSSFHGIPVRQSECIPVPFSFGRTVYLPGDIGEANRHWILLHESQHVKQYHFVDLWFTDLYSCLFWFNPMVWIIRREIKLNHEYLSDAACSGLEERETYSFALLAHALKTDVSAWSHAFSLSGQLKNRIDMLHKNQSTKRRWSYVAWVPIMGLAIAFTACERPSETERVEKEVKVSSDDELENLPRDEKDPEFPGGMKKMMEYFQDAVVYPKDMKAAGKEARVMVGFKVDKDGTISDVKAKNSDETDEAFIKEAERVVASMPKWNPGNNKRGEEVAVELVIPIVFKLPKEESHNGLDQLNRLAELKQLKGLSQLKSLNRLQRN